uniref:BRCT domain-containing protein n=1 Tax=Panagrellus redivivus TaxID=6233 RepID=A0A7E4WCS5_PANRE
MKPPSSSRAMVTPSRIPVLRGVRKAPRAATTFMARLKQGQDAAQNAVKAHMYAKKSDTEVKKVLVEANVNVPASEPSSSTVQVEKDVAATPPKAPKAIENLTPNVTVRKAKPRNFCDVSTDVPITPRRTRSGKLLARRSIFKPVVPDAEMAAVVVSQDEINRTIEDIPNLSDIPEPQALLSFSNDAENSTPSPVPTVVPRLPEIRLEFTPPPAEGEPATRMDIPPPTPTQSFGPLKRNLAATQAVREFSSSAPAAGSGHAQLIAESTPTKKTRATRSTSPAATRRRASRSRQPPAAAAVAVLPEAMVASISALDLVSADDEDPVVPEEHAGAAPVTDADNVACPGPTNAGGDGGDPVPTITAENIEIAASVEDIEAAKTPAVTTDNVAVESANTMESEIANASPSTAATSTDKVDDASSIPDVVITENVAVPSIPTVEPSETMKVAEPDNAPPPASSVTDTDAAASAVVNIDTAEALDALIAGSSATEPAEEEDNCAEMSIIISDEPEFDDVEPEPEGDAELDAAKKDLNKKRKDRRNSIFPRQAIQMLKSFRQIDQEMADEQPSSSTTTTEPSTTAAREEDPEMSSPVPKKPRNGKQIRGKKPSAKATKKAAAPKAPKPPTPEPVNDGFQSRFEVDGKIMVAIRVPKANKSGFKKIPPAVELNPLLLAEPSESCLRKPPNESWNGQKHFRWADETKEDGQDKELTHVHEFDPDYGGFRKSTFQRSMFQLHRADEEEE